MVVLAFLGDPFDGLDVALDYLTTAATVDAHPDPTVHPPLQAWKSKMDVSDERLGVYLIRFFALPWWNRIWTVQEYVPLLSKQVAAGEVDVNRY